MKLKYPTLSLFAFAIFAASFNLSAEGKKQGINQSLFAKKNIPTDPEINAKLARQIFKRACANRVSHTWKSDLEPRGSIHTICYSSLRYNPDGTMYSRTDFVTYSNKTGKELRKVVKLSNGNGDWSIYDDFAINRKVERKSQEALVEKNEPAKYKFVYKVRDSIFNKIHCYKVTVSENNPTLKENDTKVVVYEIGKSNLFIYSISRFAVNGEKKSSLLKLKVNLNPDLKDSLFEVPSDCKIFLAKTFDEYVELTKLGNDRQLMKDSSPIATLVKEAYMEKYGTTDIYQILNEMGVYNNKEEGNEGK